MNKYKTCAALLGVVTSLEIAYAAPLIYADGDLAPLGTPDGQINSADYLIANRIVLDLGAVEFIDSAGIGVLIGLRRRCLAADGECVLAELTTQADQLLRSAEVDQLFLVSSTVDEAKSLVAQRPGAT